VLAPSVVEAHGAARLTAGGASAAGAAPEPPARGQPFWKLTGSGNDFVFLDARDGLPEGWRSPEAIRRLSARGTGVGADGVVYLERGHAGDVRMRYFNADGSLAALCGNATLCTARLAALVGAADPAGMRIETDAGLVTARVVGQEPEIDLAPVTVLRPTEPLAAAHPDLGELRIGFAVVGVPHLVVRVADLQGVDVPGRGRPLRFTDGLPGGANVNFVGPVGQGWGMRTYERGVEGETLACGTGAVAVGLLLSTWGEAQLPVVLETRSGRRVTVSATREGDSWQPSLRGEGRLVFRGILDEVSGETGAAP
jgi:diaminopimelate epimerase